jgi:hypothetical protein
MEINGKFQKKIKLSLTLVTGVNNKTNTSCPCLKIEKKREIKKVKNKKLDDDAYY